MTRKPMPILACLLGLWLLALPPAPVHGVRFTWGASPIGPLCEAATSGTPSTASDLTGADTIFRTVSYLTGSVPTLTDDQTNTWTLVGTPPSAGGLVSNALWRSATPASVSATQTFTVTHGGAFLAQCWVGFPGGATSSIDDQTSSNATTGQATIAPGSITPSVPNTIVITSAMSSDGQTLASIDGGFTIADDVAASGSNFGAALAFLVQTSATAANPTWSLSGAATYQAANIGNFETTGGGGGATPCRMTLLGVGCEFALDRRWSRPGVGGQR
jgi:hypothetical protein